MKDFEQKCTVEKNIWISSPFYSHLGGYKMPLKVDTEISSCEHLAIYVCLMKGEFDNHLS